TGPIEIHVVLSREKPGLIRAHPIEDVIGQLACLRADQGLLVGSQRRQLERRDAEQTDGDEDDRDENLDQGHAARRALAERRAELLSVHEHESLDRFARPVRSTVIRRTFVPVHVFGRSSNTMTAVPIGVAAALVVPPFAAYRTKPKLLVLSCISSATRRDVCSTSSPFSKEPGVAPSSVNTIQPLAQSSAVSPAQPLWSAFAAHTATGMPRLLASLRAMLSACTTSFA